jgi:hypothetical protein
MRVIKENWRGYARTERPIGVGDLRNRRQININGNGLMVERAPVIKMPRNYP